MCLWKRSSSTPPRPPYRRKNKKRPVIRPFLYVYDLDPLFPGEADGLGGAAGGAAEVGDAQIRILHQLSIADGHAARELVRGEEDDLLGGFHLPMQLRPILKIESVPEARVGQEQYQLYIEMPLPFQQHQLAG